MMVMQRYDTIRYDTVYLTCIIDSLVYCVESNRKFKPKTNQKLDAVIWQYHANRMDARRSQFDLEEWTRTFSRGQQCSCFRTRNTFCRTRSLSNATFSFFWSRHENPMILHWDMAIYRFSNWRPPAILELFYHHTRPPTKSLSNFMSIWYTDLKI